MNKYLIILFLCLFIVMIGYGIILPVLAFYIERLALAEGATLSEASFQVGILTGIFALMQFFFAPLVGSFRASSTHPDWLRWLCIVNVFIWCGDKSCDALCRTDFGRDTFSGSFAGGQCPCGRCYIRKRSWSWNGMDGKCHQFRGSGRACTEFISISIRPSPKISIWSLLH